MDYCNGFQSFINYALSNLRNISGEVLDVHARGVKIKSFSI
jgi:hypothetical protein